MTVVTLTSGKQFGSSRGVSILDAAAQAKIVIPYSCKTGRCRTCKCKVVTGQTTELMAEPGLTEVEKADGWILSCARSADTDLVLDVDELVGVPLPHPRTIACRISSLEKLAPSVLKVVLRLPPGVTFHFIPGQYIDVIGSGGIRRSYSIANAPRADKSLELHIRAVENGAMSKYWFQKSAVNDLLRLHGPHGTFVLRNTGKRDLFFLATGTGFAPIKAMLEALPSVALDQQPASVTVAWGARHEHDIYFDALCLPEVQKYIPVLSRGEATWKGERGYVQDAVLRQTRNLRNGAVFACGSDAMIQSAKSTLKLAGLLSQNFYSESFVCSSTHEN